MILDVESNTNKAGVINRTIRLILTRLDGAAFWLLGIVYEIFFNVASAELFSNATIRSFYGRVQLILGIFMVFRLTIVTLQAIVNPDLTDDKSEGFSAIIKRVIVGLMLLAVLTPINIAGDSSTLNEYQIELNNNGLLFGTLYSLQYRILNNNTLGNLILGTKATSEDGDLTEAERVKRSANVFTSSIVKAFYRINLKEKDDRDDDDPSATNRANWMCGVSDDDIEEYLKVDSDVTVLYSDDYINKRCGSALLDTVTVGLTNTSHFVFTYIYVVPLVVAIVFIFIMIGFTVDVAVRAIKLAVLRLIAPIPIIAYMGPKKGEESFNAWTKALVSTYLDLFIRLAVIYFITYLIQDMIVNGVVLVNGEGVIGVISIIFIWIGLFVFAKEAPKFIKDALGLKDNGQSLFSGMGTILAGAAIGTGAISSGLTGYRASKEENADSEFNKKHPFLGGMRNVGAGLVNGALGLGTGATAAMKAKQGSEFKDVQAAIDARNQRRAGHATLLGGIGSGLYGALTGQTLADKDNARMEQYDKAEKAIGSFSDAVKSEALKNGKYGTIGSNFMGKDASGNNVNLKNVKFNAAEFKSAISHANGPTVMVRDINGNDYEVRTASVTDKVVDDITDSQIDNWQAGEHIGKTWEESIGQGGKLKADYDEVVAATRGIKDQLEFEPGKHFDVRKRSTYGAARGEAKRRATTYRTDMKYVKRRANSNKKK